VYVISTESVPGLGGVAIEPDGYELAPDTGTVAVLPICVPEHVPPGNSLKLTDPPGEYPPEIVAVSEIGDPVDAEPPPDPANPGDAFAIVAGSPPLLLLTEL
jgi:hypothetical protein